MIYLVELDGAVPVSSGGAVVTVGFASGGGFVSGAADTPSLTVYEPRVLTPGTMERHLWRPGSTRGRGEIGFGVVELANADGVLDYLLTYAFDGRAVRIMRGNRRWARSAFDLVLSATIAGLTVSMDKIAVRFVDKAGLVAAKPLLTARFAGDNVLPAGAEGTALDLKGELKPWVFGEAENITPPRVNSSRLIYQLSAGQLAEIVTVWEGGNAITRGTARATIAAMQATAPAAGTFDYAFGTSTEGAYIRLGSSPSLAITAYVREGAAAANRTAAQVATRILTRAGIAGSDITGATALDAAAPGVLGFAAMADTTIGDALDAVCGSVGAAWTPTRDGKFQLLRLADPTGATPAATLVWTDLVGDASSAVRLLPTADDGSIPAYDVAVSYQHNYTPMSGGQVAGAVAQDRRDWLALDYRSSSVRATAVWNPDTATGRHPLAQPISVVSELRVEADAQAEAARLLALYGTERLYLAVTVHAAKAADLDLGKVVRLVVPRFGLSGGRNFVVVGLVEDWAADTSDLYLWGAAI